MKTREFISSGFHGSVGFVKSMRRGSCSLMGIFELLLNYQFVLQACFTACLCHELPHGGAVCPAAQLLKTTVVLVQKLSFRLLLVSWWTWRKWLFFWRSTEFSILALKPYNLFFFLNKFFNDSLVVFCFFSVLHFHFSVQLFKEIWLNLYKISDFLSLRSKDLLYRGYLWIKKLTFSV